MQNAHWGSGSMKHRTRLEFVWDRQYLEFEGNKFEKDSDFSDFILDKTRDMLEEAIKNDKIFYMIKIDDVQ
jgi:hypothetical protein